MEIRGGMVRERPSELTKRHLINVVVGMSHGFTIILDDRDDKKVVKRKDISVKECVEGMKMRTMTTMINIRDNITTGIKIGSGMTFIQMGLVKGEPD